VTKISFDDGFRSRECNKVSRILDMAWVEVGGTPHGVQELGHEALGLGRRVHIVDDVLRDMTSR